MPVGNTLVSYSRIVKPFPDTGTLLAKTRDAAGKVIADSTRADARVSQLATGLAAMRNAQGKFPKVMHTPQDSMAARLQTHIAIQAVQENKVDEFILRSVNFILEAFDVQFSTGDWARWMLSFFTWIESIVPATSPAPPAEPEEIPNHFRLAVTGDWGTGLYGAPLCAESIRTDPDGYDMALHLGDVYYSGLEKEIDERLLKFWVTPDGVARRSMNGNHEMYSGGHGYFGTLLPALGQTSSYFALQNDHWTLVVLDTAYAEPLGGQVGDLSKDQLTWLDGIMTGVENRKVVLFTHHQPISQFDAQGPLLISRLQSYLQEGKIFAWYWGHEHRCLLYDPHPNYGFRGRCVGHAGFPENRVDLSSAPFTEDLGSQWRQVMPKTVDGANVPGAYALDGGNIYIPGFEESFGPNGFMRLEFQDDRLIEFVRAPDNANIYLRDLV